MSIAEVSSYTYMSQNNTCVLYDQPLLPRLLGCPQDAEARVQEFQPFAHALRSG